MITRRALLKNCGFLSLAPAIPGFLERTARAATPGRDARVLVVLQLDGGNDGINTVVPFGDEQYRRLRPELALPAGKICKLAEGIGLHPAMKAAAALFEAGHLAIVQGVGYPNPNRSHFESMAIWQTAHPGRPEDAEFGWLGRALDAARPARLGPDAVHVGDRGLPRALLARRAVATSFADASDFALALAPPAARPDSQRATASDVEDLTAFVNRIVTSAYASAAELERATDRVRDGAGGYPGTELARKLGLVARSIKAGSPARVYYVIQAGYDSHAVQLPAHERLLSELSGALKAFLDDLAMAGLGDRVAVMTFSEFGRRPAENGSLGTDHGTSGPVLLAGASVRGGLFGKTPALSDLEGGDLRWSTDFRSVYATLLDQWLELPALEILGGRFESLPVIRT